MGLDNVAVQWPRTGRFYEPVAPAEFVDFADIAERVPATARPAAALAGHIAESGTVRATGYTEYGEEVTFDTVSEVLRKAVSGGRLPEQQLRWLEERLATLRDEDGEPP